MTDALLETRASVPRPQATEVTAVVVTQGPTEYLHETLAALAAQTRAPQQVLVVDVGAHAEDAAEHEDLTQVVSAHWSPGAPGPERAALVDAAGARTFGEGVRRALAAQPAPAGDRPPGWLWLLHDDSAPEPGALAELLRAVEVAPSVAVAGCKQRTWSGSTRVVEVGVSTSRFGRRMTGIDEPEVDQGQHDGREDVLGVGTAGALVRRDVWDLLGGTDPALGPYGDGLDLSRRARLAGHRVVVVPRAVVRHAQASLARPLSGAVLNRPGWDARRSAQARREAYLHSQLTGVPVGLVPVVAVLALLSGVARALGRLVTKEPHLVVAELLAPLSVLARPGRVVRARRRAARTRRLSRRSLRPLQVTWRDVLRHAQDRRLTAAEIRRTREAPSELELAELAALRTRRRAGLAGVTLAAVALTAAVLGPLVIRVLGGAQLTGPGVSGGEVTITGLWAAVAADRVPGGLGHAGPTDPLLAALLPVTALTGTLGGAQELLLLGSLVLSAVGAWFAAGAATRSVALRAWAALVWTAAPALLVALGDGRLGAVLAHVTLPWVVLGVARALGVARVDAVQSGLVGAGGAGASAAPRPMATRRAEASLAAAAGAGLALAVATAGAPVLLPAALVALVAVALLTPRRGRLGWVALPALVLQAPVVAEAVRTWGAGGWRLLLTDPGVPVPATGASAWQQLLGWPVLPPAWAGPGLVPDTWPATVATVLPLVATGLLAAAAVVALARRDGARVVRLGWFVAACGLAAAVVAAQVLSAVADDGVGGHVVTTGWPGAGVSLAWAGLLTAALVGADGLQQAMARHAFGWRQVTAGVLVVLVVAGPLLVLGSWTLVALPEVRGGVPVADGAVALGTTDVPAVPAVGRQMQASPDAVRVLRVEAEASGDLTATLLRGDGRQLTETSRAVTVRALGSGTPPEVEPADDADRALAEATARLAAGAGEDTAVRLAELGVGAVLVPLPAGSDVGDLATSRTGLVGRIDATLGLERVTETASGAIWRVAAAEVGTTAAWARLVPEAEEAPAGTAEAVPSQGSRVATRVAGADEARLLVLAERADPGWRATLDGRPLRAVGTDWRQAFEIPADGGGLLVVEHDPAARVPWLVLQGVVLLATVLLALPARRRRGVAR